MKFGSLLKILVLSSALLAPAAASAQLADQSQVVEAQSAIQDAGKTASAVRALRNVPMVGVIRIDYRFVSPVSSMGNEIAALQILAGQNSNAIRQLRQALAANPVTNQALTKNRVDINRVVGIRIGGTGSLRAFVD